MVGTPLLRPHKSQHIMELVDLSQTNIWSVIGQGLNKNIKCLTISENDQPKCPSKATHVVFTYTEQILALVWFNNISDLCSQKLQLDIILYTYYQDLLYPKMKFKSVIFVTVYICAYS